MLAQKYLSGATGKHVIVRSRRGEPGRLGDTEVDDLCRGDCSGEEYVYLVGRGGIAGNGDGLLEARGRWRDSSLRTRKTPLRSGA